MTDDGDGRGGAPGRDAALDDWLAWLESGGGSAIDLGLDRLRPVCHALGLAQPGFRVLTVAGTNGKGSSVAVAEALLRAAGRRVGAYTSPHLLVFNERIRVDGVPATDRAIVEALSTVEAHRGSTRLTYFEYTTLAALVVFREAGVTEAVLEVGLGGRLDAVNCIDADVALLTRVAVDHAEWLGSDLDGIAREKAGVCRPDRPAVIGDGGASGRLARAAGATGASLYPAGKAFDWRPEGDDTWCWNDASGRVLTGLPAEPWWRMDWQRQNAAGAMMAVSLLHPQALKDPDRVRRVLAEVRPAGRVQVIAGPPETVLDVAHNPDAARALAGWLRARPVPGRTRAVIGMRADKDIDGVVAELESVVDEWWPADMSSTGGLSPEEMRSRLGGQPVADSSGGPAAVWRAALAASEASDRVLVLGSFMTVGPVLRELADTRHTD